eukprot:Colp12_sorted_trinity150504_noHs@109
MNSIFSAASPYDDIVEKATRETLSEEDWGIILDICDRVSQGGDQGARDALRSLVKRINHANSKVQLLALATLEACVKNCGKPFQLQIATREFLDECKRLLALRTGTNPNVCMKIKGLLQDWDQEFGANYETSLVRSMYSSLRSEGHEFPPRKGGAKPAPAAVIPPPASAEEDADLKRAIQLSLQEEERRKGGSKSNVYPTVAPVAKQKEKEKTAKALYDFEAKEEGELGFLEGEVITVLDDSDKHWWKGQLNGYTGLFPANHVTLLSGPSKPQTPPSAAASPPKTEVSIDGAKIDALLAALAKVNPAVANPVEEKAIEELFEECLKMKPLIVKKIEESEERKQELEILNDKFCKTLAVYDRLMKQPPVTYQPQVMAQPNYYQSPPTQQHQQYAPPQGYPPQQAQYAPPSTQYQPQYQPPPQQMYQPQQQAPMQGQVMGPKY